MEDSDWRDVIDNNVSGAADFRRRAARPDLGARQMVRQGVFILLRLIRDRRNARLITMSIFGALVSATCKSGNCTVVIVALVAAFLFGIVVGSGLLFGIVVGSGLEILVRSRNPSA
jgi:hypothetical protein